MKVATTTEDEDFADYVMELCYKGGARVVNKEEL